MSNLNKLASTCAVGAVLLLGGGQALAGSDTGVLGVDATVASNCTGISGTLAFSTFNPLANTDLDVDGTILLTCTVGSTATVALNGGGSNDITARVLDGPGSYTLPYQLYTTTTRDIVWGDGTNGSTRTQAGTGSQMSMTVYGRIPAATDAPAGAYSDSVIITVTF
jgi:spore coat protein U-like protein